MVTEVTGGVKVLGVERDPKKGGIGRDRGERVFRRGGCRGAVLTTTTSSSNRRIDDPRIKR